MEVLADDYAAKGDEELVEVKVGEDLIFIEKKFVKLGSSALEPSVEKSEEPAKQPSDPMLLDEDDEEITITDDDDDDEHEGLSDDDMEDYVGDDDQDENEDDDEDEEITTVEEPEEEVTTVEEPETPASEPEQAPAPASPTSDLEVLRAKLKKSLVELEDIRSDMKTTFTSTDTISTTIQSLRGMIDALRKDQMSILSRR